MNPADIHVEVQRRRLWVRDLPGRKSTLLALADLNRDHLSALDAGDDRLAQVVLCQIRLAVAPETVNAAATPTEPPPSAKPWWLSPVSLAAIGLCLFMTIISGTLWLRAIDAETQLAICTQHR